MVHSPAMLAVINLTIPLTFAKPALSRCRREVAARIDRVLSTLPIGRELARADLREESAAIICHVCSLCPARAAGRCAGAMRAVAKVA